MNRMSDNMMIVLSIGLASWLQLSMIEEQIFGEIGAWLQPHWVAVVVIYWGLHRPHKFGVLSAWCIGLWLDVLNGHTLGQQAAAMAVQAYCTYIIYVRVRLFPRWQQSLVVMVLVGLNLLVNRTLQGLVTGVTESILYYLPVLFSAIAWFVVAWGLDRFRRKHSRVQL